MFLNGISIFEAGEREMWGAYVLFTTKLHKNRFFSRLFLAVNVKQFSWNENIVILKMIILLRPIYIFDGLLVNDDKIVT